jgi:nitrite reductase/ring-hydroxylating ferredoxin subunit
MIPPGQNLVFAAKTAEIGVGKVVPVFVEGRRLALYNVAGRYYATDDRCTHADVPLSKGRIVGDLIECPLHVAFFEIATGKARGVPVTRDVRTYSVHRLGDELFVAVPLQGS